VHNCGVDIPHREQVRKIVRITSEYSVTARGQECNVPVDDVTGTCRTQQAPDRLVAIVVDRLCANTPESASQIRLAGSVPPHLRDDRIAGQNWNTRLLIDPEHRANAPVPTVDRY
jgi:hypothetical protein